MKVIDTLLFFNELDLLEIRLHEMDPIVDHFVIVESLERFGSTRPKAAVLQASHALLDAYKDKIKYVVLPKLVPPFTNPDSGYRREVFHRNELMPAILSVSTSPDDVVILSDCDEIPRMSTIQAGLTAVAKGPQRLLMDMFYYNVNRHFGQYWDMARLATVGQILQAGGPQRMRCDVKPGPANTLPNAGWHFSYFGGIPSIRNKVESFYHASDYHWQTFGKTADAVVARDIAAGRSITDHSVNGHMQWRESNDPRLPKYFLENQARFRNFTDAYFKEQNKGLL